MDVRSGLKLLSLDAAGAQGISQLQILDHVMHRISQDAHDSTQGALKRPCEVFDAIGGTGTGGLIAIFLVVLKMTAKEALEEFTKFIEDVYKSPSDNPTKRTFKLQKVIHAILEKHGMDEDTDLIPATEPPPTCKLIVPVMYKDNVGVTCVLRNHVIRQEPPTRLTVAEAMLATSAITPMFNPISIGKEFSTFEYVSGDLGLSNPIREVIVGAHHTFGDESTVACLLSIGCGHSGVKPLPLTSDSAARIDFLEQLATDSEKVAQEMATQMCQLALYHRLSVSYGPEAAQSRIWREPGIIAAQTTIYLNNLVAKVVDGCVDAIKTGHGTTTLERLVHSGGAAILPVPLPPLTRNYVERKAPMDFMEKTLFGDDGRIKLGSKRIVVTGIGGCGKTQLVRKFVEDHQDCFVSIFIVDGSSSDSLRRDVVRHVRSLNAAHSQDSFDESMTFLSQPVPDGQRLLIIDNVDNPTLDLSPFLPRWTNGAVIITSRNVSRGQLSPSAHLWLEVMSLDEELLVRGSGREWPPSEAHKEAMIVLAKELGCHPIALVQAISYMSSTGYSEETYISRLRGYREQLLSDPATHQLDMRYMTAFAAFDASYSILPLNAQKTLHILSFFHRQRFPLDLVTIAAKAVFSTDHYSYIPPGDKFELGKGCLRETFCPSGEWDPCKMDSIITSLRNQSLVTTVPVQGMTLLEMHSLVHEWGRFRVPGGTLERVQAGAVRLLCCGAGMDNYRMMPYLSSHAQELSPVWDHLHTNDAASVGFILAESRMYADAARLEERVYDLVKGQLGVEHPQTIRASGNLAATYSQLGRYAEAEVLGVDVLRERKRLLGAGHLDTITASANLACTYSQLGRYAEAEVLQVEVLRERKRLLGTDHPHTVWASENLACTYSQLGRYADAEVLGIEVLRERKRLLGTDHPETIRASANLACTYGRLGHYAEAEVLEIEVLRERKRLLGTDHPDTIQASANLACTYGQLGRYTEAEVLEVEVLRERKRLLGTDHPDTIRASANLACTYGRLGRYAEAEVLEIEVLRERKRLLGTDHPDTIQASANLASTYRQLGRYAEAEVLEVEVLREQKRLLGTDHPNTILASANLACTYNQLERYVEAEALGMDVLSERKRLLGMEHPATIDASANLAATYWWMGNYDKAEVLQVQVLRQLKELLGSDHPDTIRAAGNLAATYGKMGRHSDAEVLSKEAIRLSQSVLGLQHPKTLEILKLLAFLDTRHDRPDDDVSQTTSDPLSSSIVVPKPRRRDRILARLRELFS